MKLKGIICTLIQSHLIDIQSTEERFVVTCQRCGKRCNPKLEEILNSRKSG